MPSYPSVTGGCRRRPRLGDQVAGPTGPETVLRVIEHGRVLSTVDAIGRTWRRERSPAGCWRIDRAAEPGGGGVTPLRARA